MNQDLVFEHHDVEGNLNFAPLDFELTREALGGNSNYLKKKVYNNV